MTEIKKYEIDFVKRTLEILEKNFDSFKSHDREVTFLINCLLGLIVTVSEAKKYKEKLKVNIDDEFLSAIPYTMGFFGKEIKTSVPDLLNHNSFDFSLEILHHKDLKSKTKEWLITKIRNGIAHQNILELNEEGEWVGIKLWNINLKGERDFEVEFTIAELKNFATKIANDYIAVMGK